jgi:CubicO group peptidase (beta-lactamase class C family)
MWHIKFDTMRVLFLFMIIFYSFSVFAQTGNKHVDSKIGNVPPQIDSTIQSIVTNGNLPSLQLALISNNNVTWSKTYGNERKSNIIYKIGSIEKVITATALLQLYEKGKIDIYDDVNEYLPFSVRSSKFPDIPISVIMLMSHRSGLEMFQYQFAWDTKELRNYKDQQNNNLKILNLSEVDFMKASLDSSGMNFNPGIWKFKPGTNYCYSNSGYFILHYLIEQVSGQTYSEYVTENIFQKLGMDHSVFSYIDSTANFSNSYTRKGDEDIKLPFLPGMYTTTEDMAKFMIAHMNNGQYNGISLLQAETIELMHKKHSHGKGLFHLLSRCPYAGYGLGIIYYGDNLFGHGGSTIGYQSLWSFKKSDKSGYIISTNVNGLLYADKNFDSVWRSVSSIEKLLKSELGYSSFNRKIYNLIGIIGIGIIINILYFRRKRRKMKKNTLHNNV